MSLTTSSHPADKASEEVASSATTITAAASRQRGSGPRLDGWHKSRLVIGSALIAAGLSLLGYLIWEYFGSTVVAHHRKHHVIAQLRREWHRGQDSTKTHFGRADAIIEIPKFGPDYQVPVFEGTGDDILAVGYGHFVGAAGPGQIGNYALAAHRVTHSEPLRNMPDLRIGDTIRVLTRTHTYIYKLVTNGDDLIVPMTAQWVTTPLPHNPTGGIEPPQRPGERLITLTTCAELFHTTNREIAFGLLVRTLPAGSP